MTPQQLISQIQKKADRMKDYITRTAPRLAGQIAVNHIREDFARGGFTQGGFHAWQETRRQQSGSGKAASQYGPLLSARNRLMHSVRALPGQGQVRIYTDVPYAGIHNNGGVLRPRVTPKMRKFAWAMYYKETGISPKMKRSGKARKKRQANESEEAKRWKSLALTKKTQLSISIPRRQFMPDKPGLELVKKVDDSITNALKKIMDN